MGRKRDRGVEEWRRVELALSRDRFVSGRTTAVTAGAPLSRPFSNLAARRRTKILLDLFLSFLATPPSDLDFVPSPVCALISCILAHPSFLPLPPSSAPPPPPSSSSSRLIHKNHGQVLSAHFLVRARLGQRHLCFLAPLPESLCFTRCRLRCDRSSSRSRNWSPSDHSTDSQEGQLAALGSSSD